MILVTGGTGYIGSHTCVHLMEAGYEVLIVDNFVNSKPEVLESLQKITGKTPAFVEADICDAVAMERIFAEHEIEAVLHFAGLKAVGESVRKPLAYYDNNLTGTLVLLEAMQRHEVRKILFSSSATVYSADNEMPLTESSRLGECTNPYGWTKYMIEQILTDLCRANSAWSAVLLRYFNPIGAHESGLLGEDPQGVPNNLMPYICKVASGALEKLSVYGADYPTPDGTGVRDYIHVEDLAEGHLHALEYMQAHAGVSAFNLGTGKGYSVLEVVHAFEQASGKRVPYVVTDRRPGDVAACYADPTLAERELHWRAQYGIDKMCADSWNFVSKQAEE